MLASTAPIFAAEKTKEVGVLKTEPEEPFPFQATYDIEVERIKPETLLYADHEIKDEIVIGPTEVNCPISGTRPLNTEKIGKLLNCSVILKDVVNDLRCARCDLWCLTAADLQKHELTHAKGNNTYENHELTHTKGKNSHEKNIILITNDNQYLKTLEESASEINESRNNKQKTANIANNQRIKCITCSRYFNDQQGLQLHCKLEHVGKTVKSTRKLLEEFTKKELARQSVKHHKKTLKVSDNVTSAIQSDYSKKQSIESNNRSTSNKTFDSENCLPEEKFTCDICKASFKRKCYLSYHMIIHIKKNKKVLCYICRKKVQKSYLPAHILNHERKQQIVCKCNVCNKQFTFKHNLKRHQLQMHSEIRRQYLCDICCKEFVTRVGLAAHILRHEGKQQFICNICRNGFDCKLKLRYHLYAIHKTGEMPEEFSSPCKVCHKHLTPKLCLTKRLYQFHRGELPGIIETSKNSMYVFPCVVCQKIFYKSSCLASHKNCRRPGDVKIKESGKKSKNATPQGEKKWKCEVCTKLFCTYYERTIHSRRHTGKGCVCDICKKSFKTKRGLILHSSLHNNSEKRFVCQICNKSFALESYLKRHKILHKDEKSEKNQKLLTCDVCKKDFFNRQSITYHLFSFHGHINNTNIKCTICDKHYFSKSKLEQHMHVHTEARNVQCHICKNRYKSKQYLINHQIKVHTADAHSFPCEICRKQFKSEKKLKQHLHVHIDTSNFQCHICKKKFKRKGILKRHNLVVHMDKRLFQCQICKMQFKKNQALKRHQLVHKDFFDRPLVQCNNCNKIISGKQTLKNHVCKNNVNILKSKFACHFCNEHFSDRKSITCHLQTKHKQEKPFTCNICKEGFNEKSDLSQHIFTTHFI